MTRTFFTEPVAEGKSLLYTGTLVDERGSAIPGGDLTALTLTLFAILPGRPIINDVDDVDLLSDPRGTVSAEGALEVLFTPEDMAIIATGKLSEKHIALLEWEWGGGKAGGHEIQFTVRNMTKIA